MDNRRQAADPPLNILFIIVDQMRGDCLGLTGHPVVETPNLDGLGHKGTVFTSAYTPCPSCVAARASLFTGLAPTNHGRLGYADRVPWKYPNMLAEVVANAGYQTHCIGKTHFYPQRAHRGFHSIESYEAAQNLDGDYVNDYWEWLAEKTNGRLHEFDHGLESNSWVVRPSALPEELHNNTWVVTRGIEFLRRRDKTRPFFLNLSFHRPHPPIDPPQVFYDMYKDRPVPPVPVGEWAFEHDRPVTAIDAWRGRLPEGQLAAARRAYYAQIAHIDCQIGRFMRAMERMELGPTAIIFTSDHGEMLGDHHLFRKCYAYEGSARIPLIISVPGGVQGRTERAPVSLYDLYPAIIELAGGRVPKGIDGRSLLPFTRDNGRPARWREHVHGEHTRCYDASQAMQYLTDGREKYIWFTVTGREQLFNLEEDPGECYDLSNEPSARERLERWRDRMVKELATRPQDGLSDGTRLIPGVELPAVRPELRAG